jgi:TetR/AcrR family transcriptional regulator
MASPTDSASAPATSTDDATTRERILDVALKSFAELGFDGSSTRAIAARAGVNQWLIPYYFGTKDALWREAVSRAFARLGQEVGGALVSAREAGSPEDIAVLIRRYIRFVAAHPEFVMMMNEEGKRDGERMRWLVDTHVRPVFEAMTELYEHARASGNFAAGIGVPHFHYLFVGAAAIFHQAAECRRLFGIDPSHPEVVEHHADAVVQLFLGDPTLGRSGV